MLKSQLRLQTKEFHYLSFFKPIIPTTSNSAASITNIHPIYFITSDSLELSKNFRKIIPNTTKEIKNNLENVIVLLKINVSIKTVPTVPAPVNTAYTVPVGKLSQALDNK